MLKCSELKESELQLSDKLRQIESHYFSATLFICIIIISITIIFIIIIRKWTFLYLATQTQGEDNIF